MDVRDFTQFERSTENSLKILSKGRSRKVVSFNEDLGDLRSPTAFLNGDRKLLRLLLELMKMDTKNEPNTLPVQVR